MVGAVARKKYLDYLLHREPEIGERIEKELGKVINKGKESPKLKLKEVMFVHDIGEGNDLDKTLNLFLQCKCVNPVDIFEIDRDVPRLWKDRVLNSLYFRRFNLNLLYRVNSLSKRFGFRLKEYSSGQYTLFDGKVYLLVLEDRFCIVREHEGLKYKMIVKSGSVQVETLLNEDFLNKETIYYIMY